MFRFGIIGAGKIARKFCDAVRLVGGAEVCAVSGKDIIRAKEFATEKNIPYYSDSYAKILTDSDVDAVYIATTHNFHYENALLCLEHGKPVLIEKAMATCKKQATRIFDLAKSKNLFAMEAMWSRFLPHVNKARRWIEDGVIGTPSMINCSIGFKADPNPNARYFSPSLGGGAMYDIGVYAIELVSYIVNQSVCDVQVMAIRADTGVDLTDNISIRFNTCIANLQTTFAAEVPRSTIIFGNEGYILIPNIISGDECLLYQNNELKEKFKEEYANGFTYEVEEVIRCVRGGLIESPVVPHADTLMCCEIFDKVLDY